MKSKTGFNYSLDNSKMGDVVSISVTPGVTCAKDVPCGPKCYANKVIKLRPNVGLCYAENTRLLKDEKKYVELVTETEALLKFSGADKFRFNVGGDFFSTQYLEAALFIAQRCPDTMFWAFTKQYDIVAEEGKRWSFEDWPKNFTLVLSRWGDYKPPEELTEHFGVCWFADKKGEYEIPDDAFVCKGGCDTCMRCAGLKANQNVVIHQH